MNKLVRFKQLRLLTSALFMEIIREPGVLFWGIVFPILMSLGLGLAFTKKAEMNHSVAVVRGFGENSGLSYFLKKKCNEDTVSGSGDHTWSYTMKDEVLGNTRFRFIELSHDSSVIMLKRGTISLILSDNNNTTEFHFDPLNSDAELTFLKLSPLIEGDDNVLRVSGTRIRPLNLPGTRYIDFLIPGLITMGVMMSTMWGLSYGLIEKRSKKLLRRLVATPMKKSHFLIALISVRFTMNLIEATVLIIFAILAFKMDIQGDPAALFLVFAAGNIAFSGIAVLLSSHTSNTEVGNGLVNAVVMPMMVLSGIFFSYHHFPEWSLSFIRNLPLTMMTDGVRSIFNEGAGLKEVALPVIILTTTGVVFFLGGLKVFKWH